MNPPVARLPATVAVLHASAARRALAGFSLSGFLAALPGAFLAAWGHHLDFEFRTVGHYFLALTAGVLVSAEVTRRLLPRKRIGNALLLGCGLACAVLVYLGFVSPPMPAVWRIGGLLAMGFAAGLLNSALFHAISPAYQQDPPATVNLGGVFFGLGCLVVTLLAAGTFYAYSVGTILCFAALLPGLFGVVYSRTDFSSTPIPAAVPLRRAWVDFKSPDAILLALLLFFQFGNEWSIAGWLSVYLVGRLGVSPELALWALAFYWLMLLLGRVAAIAALPRISHARLLAGSAGAAMFGCTILLLTDNLFGAYTGLVLIGGGFAPIYPLVAEKIGHRFTYYHPGLFNGIFSLAMIGAMLAPATGGYLAAVWGTGMVMMLPLAGTVMVFALILLIWLESKLGG